MEYDTSVSLTPAQGIGIYLLKNSQVRIFMFFGNYLLDIIETFLILIEKGGESQSRSQNSSSEVCSC